MKPERTNHRPQPWPLTVSAKTQPGALLFVRTEQMTQWADQDTHRKGWLSSSKSEYLRYVWGQTFLLFSWKWTRTVGLPVIVWLIGCFKKLQIGKETSFYIETAENQTAASKCLAKITMKIKDKIFVIVVVHVHWVWCQRPAAENKIWEHEDEYTVK